MHAAALWCIGETFNTFISGADRTCDTFQTEGPLDFAFRYMAVEFYTFIPVSMT